MQAIVVYESHWGNTAAVARAIAQGIGPGAQALSTTEATPELVRNADLIVAGAPLLGFQLPKEDMVRNLAAERSPSPPGLSHPVLRSWLESLPAGKAGVAAFETRIWWSPGSAAKTVLESLERLGYRRLAEPRRFIVKGRYGPLRDGELENAKAWGAELARALG